jgi:DNA invertase Pin-like site-specific DNA recombinase
MNTSEPEQMLIGYARTSTTEQVYSLEAQREALEAFGCNKVYHEQLSAASTSKRAELGNMIEFARTGDTVVITRLDRLARNVRDLLDIVEGLQAEGIGLVVLDLAGQQLDTTTASGKFMLTMLAAVAEMELTLRKERQVVGIKKAKEAGKYTGRKPSIHKHKEEALQLKKEGLNISAIAERLGLSRNSVYKLLG